MDYADTELLSAVYSTVRASNAAAMQARFVFTPLLSSPVSVFSPLSLSIPSLLPPSTRPCAPSSPPFSLSSPLPIYFSAASNPSPSELKSFCSSENATEPPLLIPLPPLPFPYK